jgi:hypothetical protein
MDGYMDGWTDMWKDKWVDKHLLQGPQIQHKIFSAMCSLQVLTASQTNQPQNKILVEDILLCLQYNDTIK